MVSCVNFIPITTRVGARESMVVNSFGSRYYESSVLSCLFDRSGALYVGYHLPFGHYYVERGLVCEARSVKC